MENKKKLLIIAATHGDESIGIQVIKALKGRGYDKFFDYLVANPKALKAKRRFIDFDLNRSYLGKRNSTLYEKRLAYENIKIAKKYRYIIDLHEASRGRDDFIIIPRKKTSTAFPIRLINLEKVLLWPDPKGSISQVLTRAVELEFGSKNRNRKNMIEKATDILEDFIRLVYLYKNARPSLISKKEFYYVYGKLLIAKRNNLNLNKFLDFRFTRIGNEKFYPLLIGQYLQEGILCYKMKRINFSRYAVCSK